MATGYMLVHVLEVVAPGHDLGEGAECEVGVAGHAARSRCPVPSTLQSENITLPIAWAGGGEPIVRVRAFNVDRESVGVVVVPVGTLVPLEVWNVWYAMDEGEEGEEDEADDRPPEEVAKMHLLLQYVSGEVAMEETPQLREMRSQDFLLRALQQLNASLEAKVLVHGTGSSDLSIADVDEMTARLGLVPPALPSRAPAPADVPGYLGGGLCASGGSSVSAPSAASLPSALNLSRSASASTLPPRGPPEASPPPQQARSIHSYGLPHAPQPYVAAPVHPPIPQPPPPVEQLQPQDMQRATPLALAQKKHLDEAVKRRIEPYERIVEALEERQRFFDDQEARTRQLAVALEAQERRSQELHAKLLDASRRDGGELEAERDAARQALATRGSIEQRSADLQQEVTLRRAHEDSLQKRIALMESELTVVHQKCGLLDAMEEEAHRVKAELDRSEISRTRAEESLEELRRKHRVLQDEMEHIREDHSRVLEKVNDQVLAEKWSAELLQQSSQNHQDIARDKEAENRLLLERVGQLMRQAQVGESEVASSQQVLELEKARRHEAERKLDAQELKPLRDRLTEHQDTIGRLREESAVAKQETHDERTKACDLERALGEAKAAAERHFRRVEDLEQQVGTQDELRERAAALRIRSEQLDEVAREAPQVLRRMADSHEKELKDRAQVELSLCRERDERQTEVAELRLAVSAGEQQARDLQLCREQLARGLHASTEPAARAEELQWQLAQSQREVRELRSFREATSVEVGRLVAQFQQQTLQQSNHSSEIEATLDDRNNEIKLLMYRVQELSSKYTPVRGDVVDAVLAKWVNGYRPAVPFFRLGAGLYLFGRRQISCKIANDKPVFRVGGGFVGFDKFLELYASEELERLLNYEMDDRTGEPKFVEGHRFRRAMDEPGALDDLRDRTAEAAERAAPGRATGRVERTSALKR